MSSGTTLNSSVEPVTAATTASRTSPSMIPARRAGESLRSVHGRDLPANGSRHLPGDTSIPGGILPAVASGTLPPASGSITVHKCSRSIHLAITGVAIGIPIALRSAKAFSSPRRKCTCRTILCGTTLVPGVSPPAASASASPAEEGNTIIQKYFLYLPQQRTNKGSAALGRTPF